MASSSSDASSQSGMADNETEPEPTPTAAPQKKKRTRTLTTPHQSAVLHALLAKSRFPTTAMREDVGRQIGLSARKVQIWFQNQRQKARRPQSDSAPLTRPPQFGPFPIIPSAGPSSYPSPPAGGPASELSHSGPGSVRSRGSLDSNPPLSGPGIPGSSHKRGHSFPEERGPSRRPPTSPDSSKAIPARDARGSTRAHVETSPRFSRVLPPITLEPRGSPVSATSSFPSRTFVNTVLRHDSPALEPSSPGRPGIPPPFALQPQPQWDPHTFAPFTRPEFASWSHTSGSARSSFSPTHVSPHASHLDPSSRGLLPSPSRGQRHSSSSRAAAPGQGHARSDDDIPEA